MRIAYLTLVILCIYAAHRPLAQEDEQTSAGSSLDLKSHISVGTMHDSNVSIKEIDSQLKESDTARMLGIGLSARTKLGKLELGSSYSFNQSKYRSFSEFNRESNILGIEVSGPFLGSRSGLSFHKADAKLGNEDFLELERWSPYFSRFFTKRTYFRTSFIDQTKTIIPRPGQSSKSESITLDAYYFQKGLRKYFNVGAIVRQEKASTNRYSNRSNIIRLRMLGRIRTIKSEIKYEISWNYEEKDFNGIWPRSDN
ncbi:MAG: hypothetical protein P8J18_07490, partial [Halieaceae bacterium]|nr:hypothetical protein [Halieaceae bacterium]